VQKAKGQKQSQNPSQTQGGKPKRVGEMGTTAKAIGPLSIWLPLGPLQASDEKEYTLWLNALKEAQQGGNGYRRWLDKARQPTAAPMCNSGASFRVVPSPLRCEGSARAKEGQGHGAAVTARHYVGGPTNERPGRN
jgi:hypothetical protein